MPFDPKRAHGTVHDSYSSARYIQDGIYYDRQGNVVPDPGAHDYADKHKNTDQGNDCDDVGDLVVLFNNGLS